MGCVKFADLLNKYSGGRITVSVQSGSMPSSEIKILVHFGVIMCINLAIGCATSPLGLNLHVVAGLTTDPVETVVNKHTIAYIL